MNDNKKTMSSREKYIDRLATKLKKWDRELEEFEKKNEKRFAELKHDIKRRIEKLKMKRKELSEKMDRLEKVGKDKSRELKNDAEKLWNDIKHGFKSLKKEAKK